MNKAQTKRLEIRWILATPLLVGAVLWVGQAHAIDLKLSQTLSVERLRSGHENHSVIHKVGHTVSERVNNLIEVTTQWVHNSPKLETPVAMNSWADRAIEQTKSLMGKLPSPTIPFEIREGAAGIDFPTSGSSHVTLGNLSSQHGQFHDSDRSGIHWVNRVDQDTSFFVGIQRNSGDAKETTSGIGFIYDLN